MKIKAWLLNCANTKRIKDKITTRSLEYSYIRIIANGANINATQNSQETVAITE